MRGPARLLALLAVAALVPGCASSSSEGPFAADGPTRAEGSETHRVRFEVRCDRCYVSWSVDRYGGQDQQNGPWSEVVTVTADPSFPARAHLTASAVPGGGRVSVVRISVDGRTAAQAGDEGDRVSGLPNSLSVTAEVPPPQERPIVAGGAPPG